MPTEEPETGTKKPGATPQPAAKGGASAGFSAFLGKVLEQLSLSAWLPAAMLIGNCALLLQLNQNRSLNLGHAIRDLSAKPLGTVVILLFSLILATLVTQAFEFEIVRLLEGYLDATSRAVHRLVALRIRRHEHKLRDINSDWLAVKKNALSLAKAEMSRLSYDQGLIEIIEAGIAELDRIETVSEHDDEAVDAVPWRGLVPSGVLYRLDALENRLRAYPSENRVLPTRLGNVLRAAEDQLLLDSDEELELFVIRYYDELPETLRNEHEEFRTRLDMYCCLVLVFVVLTGASVLTLLRIAPMWASGLICLFYAVMAWVSYEAAIASARGYGGVLQEIGRHVRAQHKIADAAPAPLLARLRVLLHRHLM